MEKRVEIVSRSNKAMHESVVVQGQSRIHVPHDANVRIIAPPKSVSSLTREGEDMILQFDDGSTVRLEGYFDCPVQDIGQIQIDDPAGGAAWLVNLDTAACYTAGDVSSAPIAYNLTPFDAAAGAAAGHGLSSGALIALGALGIGGGVAAAVSGGGHKDHGTSPPADTTPPAAPTVAPSRGTVLTGSAEAGSTVKIDVNGDGSVDATVKADSSGHWSYTPPNPITDGTTISVVAVDAAGNVSTAAHITIDAVAPAAPTIAPTDGTVLTGTAEAGSTVNIDVNGDGKPDGTVTAGSNGTWTFTPSTPLGDGTTVTVTATDPAGNTSAPTSVTLDFTAPAAPVLASVTDDVGVVQGALAAGAVTDDTTPKLSGTAEPGSTISIYDHAGLIGTVIADAATGAWSFIPGTALHDGAHSLTVTATDAAGNVSTPSAPFALTVDTVAPAPPMIAPSEGTVLSGTAEPGSIIRIDLNGDGMSDAAVSTNDSGTWTYTPAAPLADGTTITATATDAAGNTSAPTSITLDLPPPTPELASVSDDVGVLQGPLSSGATTDDPTPTLSGTAEAGSTLSVYDGATLLGTVAADGTTGAWSFTPGTPLTDGAHSLTVTATDGGGKASMPTAPFTLTVDTIAPATPTIDVTNGTHITGTAEPGSIVRMDLDGDGVPDVSVVADPGGTWSYLPGSQIPDGTKVTVTASDPAGNVSPPAETIVDANVPFAPIIIAVADNSEVVADGGISNDPLLIITGAAEPGSTVTVFDGATVIGMVTANATTGAWSLSTPALSEGLHAFTATATDAVGNVGNPSAVQTVTIDLTPPSAPLLHATDGTTLSGTAEAGATVLVDTNGDGTPDTSTIANASGLWSVTFAPALADDTIVSVVAVDPAGNISPAASVTVDVALDTTPPPVPMLLSVTDDVAPVQGPLTNGAATNDDTPTLTGTAEPGVLVSIYDGTTLLASVLADPVTGDWSFTPLTPLAQGPHSLAATTTDNSGNQSMPSAGFDLVIDTVPPPAPVIAPSNGATLSGTAEPGALVSLDLDHDGTADVTVAADPNTGVWAFTPATPIADGVIVTATATDAAGNVSTAGSTTVDAQAPLVPAISSVSDDVGAVQGPLANGAATDDPLPTLSGTTEPGATITVFDGAAAIGTAVADATTGVWSFTPAVPLTEGGHVFTITATDALGNESAASGPFAIFVDTIAPALPTIASANDNTGLQQGPVPNGGVTDDVTPTLTGSAEANATVIVFADGLQIGTTTADGTGAWSFTPGTGLSAGHVTFLVTATDAAGNVSGQSGTYTLTIDNGVPAAPTITAAIDTTGPVQGPLPSGSTTDDSTPALSGTSAANAVVTILQNGAPIATITADALGTWRYTAPVALGDATYVYTALVTSAAGVVGLPSAPFTLTVDTSAPSIPTIFIAEDHRGSIQGLVFDGGVTDDVLPVLSGTADAGATVMISDNGVVVGVAVANVLGTWSLPLGTALAEGPHAFTATAGDAAGNSSAASPVFSLVIDTIAPATPIVEPSQGLILTGTAEPNATVSIDLNGDGTADVTVHADGAGAWTYDPIAQLPGGTTVIVTATDAAGNTSGSASTVIDNASPLAPVILTVTDEVAPQTGTVASGGATDDTLPVISGTAEAGATVTVFDTSTAAIIGQAVASSSGQWTLAVTTALGAGPHAFTASAADALGNVSPTSATYTVTVDASTPGAPVITTVTDDMGATVGNVPDGGSTDDALPAIGGTGPANATISIHDGGLLLGTTTSDAGGIWSFTPTTALPDGPHALSATATSAAGNVSAPSSTYDFGVDTTPPSAPIITLVSDDAPGIIGPVANGGLTNDTSPTVSGTAEANSVVSIFINGSFVTNALADGTGAWTYTPTLSDGPQTIVAHSIDAAGNAGPLSAAFSFTVDATAPAAPVVNPANGLSVLTGNAEPGAAVHIDIGAGTTVASVSADPVTGAWTYTFTANPGAGTPIVVTAIDAAGNTSGATTIAVDQTPPGAPVLSQVNDDQGLVTGPVAPNGATDDTHPALTGTAEPGTLVTILDNGSPIGTTQAGGTGDWTFTPTSPLVDGQHSITITATDPAGNTGVASSAFGFTVITGTPSVPVIASVTDNTAPQTGPVPGGGSTNDTTPLVEGTATPGTLVTLYVDGVSAGTTIAAGPAGAWSFEPTLNEGPHTFTVSATNAAGTQSGLSSGYAITVDTIAPAGPLVNPSDGTTVSGEGEAGTLIQIFVDGDPTPATSATVDSFGHWSATFAPQLVTGEFITAIAIDPAGNPSPLSLPAFVDNGVPTTPPPAPVIDPIKDDVGTVQGPIANGGVTNDPLPVIAGVSAPDTLILIYDGNTVIGAVASDPVTGAWSVPVFLGEGPHSISATATADGLQSAHSTPTTFTVDLTPPVTPTIAPSNGGTLTGTAEAGSFVDLDTNNDGTVDVTVTANGSGVWNYTPGSPLSNGTVVTATSHDAAGNASGPSTQTIDRTAPAVPSITNVSDDVAPGIGSVPPGGTTNDTTPTLAGAAEAGSIVSIFDGAGLLGTALANGAGAWTFTGPAALAGGAHSFTVTATDGLGNVSGASAAYTVTIVTALPAAPAITSAFDDFGTIQGPIPSGGATNDSTPTLSGTAAANTTVTIRDGGTVLGSTTSDGTGHWTFATTPIGNGTHNLTAIATNAAGDSGSSATYTVNVDTIAPPAPVLTAVSDHVGTIQGPIANGGVTNDAAPTLTGTAEAGATLSILDGAQLLGTATANASGAWSFSPGTALAPGLHSLTATATDAVGNTGPATASFAFTVDTAAPAAPVIVSALDDAGALPEPVANGGSTDDAAPLLSGTAEANAVVSIFNNGALLGTLTASGSGNWSFTPPSPLVDGPHSFTAIAADAAGNASAASTPYSLNVDTVAPAAPVIVTATDHIAPITGTLANGAPTNDPQPTFAGTAEAGSSVSVFDGGVLLGTTVASGTGAWTFTPTGPLTDGNHVVTVQATDAAGNHGPASSPFTVRVDTIAPSAPVISSVTDDVGTIQGPVSNGGVTNDTVPLLRGTAEAGSTLTVLANGTAIGTTQVDATGNWSFSPATLAEGTYAFTATATDAAGNLGQHSANFTITVDTTAPAVPVITSIIDDVAPNTGVIASGGASNDANPQLTGTAAANTAVMIYDGANLIGNTASNGSGAWSFTPGTAIANGAHSFTVIAVDAAGNASAASNAYGLAVDTVAPSQTIAITTLVTDTGTLGDWSTQDTSPTIGGTLSAALGAGEQVQVQIDGGTWVNATASGTSWFLGTGTLAIGAHTIGARIVDAAGNIGTPASHSLAITAVPQEAPMVQVTTGALLGLVGIEALNLIDLGGQSISVVDPNDNLRSVKIVYSALVGLSAGFTGSTALAAELGLQFSVVDNPGLFGIGASSTLTVTAIGGGTIDNLTINEFLNSVHFQQSLLGVDLLDSIQVTATDSTNLTTTASAGSLINVSLLSPTGSPLLIEGGSGADNLVGTTGNDRIYGHGGNDTIDGGAGNDFIRGGPGADTLHGGSGNDTLVYDSSDLLIDGGTGTDTLLIDTGTGTVLNLDTATNIRNIEVIDLGTGGPGRSIILSEAGVLRATESTHTLTVNGDGADKVTMTGAHLQGQTLINGEAYNHYTLGTADIYVDHPVLVVT